MNTHHKDMNTHHTPHHADDTSAIIAQAAFSILRPFRHPLCHALSRTATTRLLGLLLLLLTPALSRAEGDGSAENPYVISDLSSIASYGLDKHYRIAADLSIPAGFSTISGSFTGRLEGVANDDGLFPVLSGLTQPIFETLDGGQVCNIMLQNVNITGRSGPVGAICCTAQGAARIYNCGILPTDPGDIRSNPSQLGSSDSYCGGLVGLLIGSSTARVINCFSFADIVSGDTVAGLVGCNRYTSSQQNYTNAATTHLRTMVMNCMYYGEITGGNKKYPVYGTKSPMKNDDANGINPYCYFYGGAQFSQSFTHIDNYAYSWPADEEYLTRFEYYRSILNSNRRLCAWWVNGTLDEAPTDEAMQFVAKWVLDPTMAPYPILKKWGKYPSVINADTARVWDAAEQQWVTRTAAAPYEGKRLGWLTVHVKPGARTTYSGPDVVLSLPILDMDTLHFDYNYAKVQLPYYNTAFGNPSAATWDEKYAGNYTDAVVTGWKIMKVNGSTIGTGTFVGEADKTMEGYEYSDKAWESGYNFADRTCSNKDLYAISGRVFAQGGYYYVPEGVTEIEIEAYWGKAFYLQNSGHYVDRVNVTHKGEKYGDPFKPAGTLPSTFQGQAVFTDLQEAIKGLQTIDDAPTVYDQALVLVGNFHTKNRSNSIAHYLDSKIHPFTITSVDLDFDEEPDYILAFQFRNTTDRPGVQPIRFDFLPVPELGLAVRHNAGAYCIGILVPEGHFEITETSFMHTTQFEYSSNKDHYHWSETKAGIILNGGHFEQIVARYGNKERFSYFIMGGHFRMLRFTPGHHATDSDNKTRHCAVNVIGADVPELYLSGIYAPNKHSIEDNPHCYINGGRFDIVAGSGYEEVNGDVMFKIDHALIDEFYGGGINAAIPIGGSVDVTINHSRVRKYCGGPQVGNIGTNKSSKSVSTSATGTIFGEYYGAGNGGTSYYREPTGDGTPGNMWSEADWRKVDNNIKNGGNYNKFKPAYLSVSTYDNEKGNHALFEFEVFNSSNGLDDGCVTRTFTYWGKFGTTTIYGDVTSRLDSCIVEGNFYGGGNLGTVTGGTVNSTLSNTIVRGSAYAGGFSAQIPSFRIHDTSSVVFPKKSVGYIYEKGHMDYVKEADGSDRYYTWTNECPSGVSTTKPTFQGADNRWYCYTTQSLDGLGNVEGNTRLTIDGTSHIGTDGDAETGHVFGGGNESHVTQGDTRVVVTGQATVLGNVYGGGNVGQADRSTNVVVEGEAHVKGHVFGGGRKASVGTDASDTARVSVRGRAHVDLNVYGGGEMGIANGKTKVEIGDPTQE